MNKLSKILDRWEKSQNSPLFKIRNLEEYLAMPREQRYKWGIFYLYPVSLQMKDWKKVRAWAKENHPIQYFIREVVGLWVGGCKFTIKDKIYYLKCLFWYRYNILKLRDEPTYMDPRHKLELAFEAIIKEFIEKEKAFETIVWDSDEGHIAAKKAIERAYNWFVKDRDIRQKEIDDLLDGLYSGVGFDDFLDRINEDSPERTERLEKLWDLENKMDKEQKEILIDVVKHMDYLWT